MDHEEMQEKDVRIDHMEMREAVTAASGSPRGSWMAWQKTQPPATLAPAYAETQTVAQRLAALKAAQRKLAECREGNSGTNLRLNGLRVEAGVISTKIQAIVEKKHLAIVGGETDSVGRLNAEIEILEYQLREKETGVSEAQKDSPFGDELNLHRDVLLAEKLFAGAVYEDLENQILSGECEIPVSKFLQWIFATSNRAIGPAGIGTVTKDFFRDLGRGRAGDIPGLTEDLIGEKLAELVAFYGGDDSTPPGGENV